MNIKDKVKTLIQKYIIGKVLDYAVIIVISVAALVLSYYRVKIRIAEDIMRSGMIRAYPFKSSLWDFAVHFYIKGPPYSLSIYVLENVAIFLCGFAVILTVGCTILALGILLERWHIKRKIEGLGPYDYFKPMKPKPFKIKPKVLAYLIIFAIILAPLFHAHLDIAFLQPIIYKEVESSGPGCETNIGFSTSVSIEIERANSNSTIYVPDNYTRIQWAIGNASDGDTIRVRAGTYYENLFLNKSLTLIGENKSTTIIDGNWTYDVVLNVTADGVKITGFTIRSGNGLPPDDPNYNWISIHISSSNNLISGNIVSRNLVGILLDSSDGNTINGNLISYSMEGISLWNSHDNILKDNKIDPIDPIVYLIPQYGITLSNSRFNVITRNTVLNNPYGGGIALYGGSYGNTVSDNYILNNEYGVILGSNYNKVVGNTISKSAAGILISYTARITVVGNTISNTYIGIRVQLGKGNDTYNTFYHNNLIDNTDHVRYCRIYDYETSPSPSDAWDNGAEGNYWGDYNGTDMNGDGIGDTNIPHQGVDNYPLMGMFSDFPVTLGAQTYHVTTICNSTVSGFSFSQPQSQISFNVTGKEGSIGFCRIRIPHALVEPGYNVTINDEPPLSCKVLFSNSTHTTLYFTYHHTTFQVKITIPEFPSALILPLLMIIILVVVILRRKCFGSAHS